EFIRTLADYKISKKCINDFFDKYLHLMVKEKGCWILHPGVKQAGTSTGRISMAGPNLMQIPKRRSQLGAEPPKVRKPFCPRPGYVWIIADYCLTGDTLIETTQGSKQLRNITISDKVFSWKDNKI